MKYKFIASDFDGTLLGSNDKISPRNVEAIRKYFEAGGIFTVSTGRTFESIMLRMDELNLPTGKNYPVISFQGSVIGEYPTKSQRNVITIDNDTVLAAIDCANEAGVYFHLYTIDKLLIKEPCKMSEMYCVYNRLEHAAMYVGDLSDYVKKHNPKILKLVYLDEEEKISRVNELLNKRLADKLINANIERWFLESVSLLSGKGRAVVATAAEFNIAPHEIIAIGDSMNDYTMIKAAGLGVALKNASQELKAAADLVAPVTNDEDAIAWVIERALKDEL